ncbi:MAG: phosphatidylserine/phosphatidylglycerophosphate/cardiolipin synthase family protein [Oscillospiraceae bacterium]|nr:phosphatidylserine/phosphatidylglycerophosphate/cardiolipin synthase family protein [Oscillospiraceae bacterium]
MNDYFCKTQTYLENTLDTALSVSESCVYFASGEEKFARLFYELKRARRQIDLEYFIIEKGVLWENVLAILKQKIDCGVKVRIICDAVGSLKLRLGGFRKSMAELGIEVRFLGLLPKRIKRSDSSGKYRWNSGRDHRKIVIIDQQIAFCGGLNLSDMYANLEEKFGYWKDTAVLVNGDCASELSQLFQTMWDFLGDLSPEIAPATLHSSEILEPPKSPELLQSYINLHTLTAPVFDVSHDKIATSEHMLIHIIMAAKESVYIFTPYLICGSGMLSVLAACARSGVDVRIVVPFIADKKLVKIVTESYYQTLLENHVRIFEYLPGFIHAKNIIADSSVAMVGSANLDYRSLYLNHECGIFMVGGEAVASIANDFDKTFELCKEITLQDVKKFSLFKRTIQFCCRGFRRLL